MTRKKSIKKIEKQQNIVAIPAQEQSLSYQGKVKVQIACGNKIISTKNYNNSGLPILFKFLSYVLAGHYYSHLRPCKLAIFKCVDTGDNKVAPVNFNWETVKEQNKLYTVSPYVVYDATPTVLATANGYATTFRFKIPYNWLYLKSFNTMGLFTENNEVCAYYLFKKEEGTGDSKQIVWDTQNLEDAVGNYSLIIEWTMEISNK